MTAAGMKMWVAMGEGRGGELGFLTTNERKEEMCLLLREAMKCSRISVHRQFVSLSQGSEKGKTRLKDELANYCVINEVPKSAFGKTRKTFTGSPASAMEVGARAGVDQGVMHTRRKDQRPPGRHGGGASNRTSFEQNLLPKRQASEHFG